MAARWMIAIGSTWGSDPLMRDSIIINTSLLLLWWLERTEHMTKPCPRCGNYARQHKLQSELKIEIDEAFGVRMSCRMAPCGEQLNHFLSTSFIEFLNRS